MSYNVYIGEHWQNITTNVSKMFYDFIPAYERSASEFGLTADQIATQSRGGIWSLDGLTGRDAIPVIKEFYAKVENAMFKDRRPNQVGHPEFLAKYDAKNGWGSTLHTMTWMARLLFVCIENPDERIRVTG